MAAPAPSIQGIIESVLYVADLDRATVFYRDVLGLERMAGDGENFQVFRVAGQALLLFRRGSTLAPMSVPGGLIPPHDGSGPQHIGFAVNAADYEAWRTRLVGRGVTIESEVAWERGGRSLYFRDPDEHAVELATPGIWPNY